MEYPIDQSLISVVPSQLSKSEAQEFLGAVRSKYQHRAGTILSRLKLVESDLTSRVSWQEITAFSIASHATKPVSAEEVRHRLERAGAQLGSIKNIISVQDLLIATGGAIDVDPTDESRQVGFDIGCLMALTLTRERTGLTWSLARTKRKDHPDYQQPCLTGFLNHLEFIPFSNYDGLCDWTSKNRSKDPLWAMFSNWMRAPISVK